MNWGTNESYIADASYVSGGDGFWKRQVHGNRCKHSNRLIVSGLIWGLAFRLLGEGSAGAVHFLMNISIPVILLFLLFSLCILGAGDIKLFSIAGGFLTLTQLCYLIPVAFVVGAVIGAGKIVYKKVTVGYAIGTKTFMHFSTAILIGYFIVVWGWGIA